MKQLSIGDTFELKMPHSFKLNDDMVIKYKLLAYCPNAQDCYKQIQLERVSINNKHPEEFGYSKYMLNELLWLKVRGYTVGRSK